MPKKSISSLELAAIINELQFLVNGKISQIYHQDKKEFLFQLHAQNKGKQLLKIVPGKFMCLTKKKGVPLKPSSFCMQLRKHLNNAFIRKIQQKGSERIIIFELEKKTKYFLIIELFSKGNLILTDEKYNIIGVLERQTWKDRTVKVKEKYVFPKAGIDWKKLTEKELFNSIKKSEKRSLVIALATDIGLGGLYAEEICKINQINKNLLPKEVDKKGTQLILKTIRDFLKLIESLKGYIYEEQITPFPLSEGKPNKTLSSYNEAIDTLNPFEIVSPYEIKIKSMEKRVNEQEEAIKRLAEKIKLNTKKGELIYEKYAPLQKLLDIVNELKKDKEWKDIAKELKKEKKIKSVDLRNKKVVIDL